MSRHNLKAVFCTALLSFALIFNSTSTLMAGEDAFNQNELESKIDAFIAKLMTDLDVVPGYSVAVATADGTIFAKGYGATTVIDGVPMTADTQVYIASSTKSLTALAITSLVNKGQIELDTPIKTYLPALSGTPAGGITFRQLLSHTHGLVENALTWRTAYSGDYSTETLIEIVNNLTLAENPEAFSYSNTGYVIASMVLEHKFGKSWKTIVEEEVLIPAGMTSTTAYISKLDKNYARPHSWYGVKNAFPMPKKDNTMHAAGGHFSTATDMGRWLQLQLSDGAIAGKQIFPTGVVASTREAQTTLQAEFYTYQRQAYGFGWYQADYNGLQMVHHFGSYSGYRAHVSFVPELGIGVAVLINDASRPGFNLPDMIANYVYDLASGVEDANAKPNEEITMIAGMIQPMLGRTPPAPPRNAPENEARYAGSYTNPEFGTIRFEMVEGELIVSMGNLSSKTTYKDDGAIRMELSPYQGTLGRFHEDQDGTITGFRYRGTNYVKEIS